MTNTRTEPPDILVKLVWVTIGAAHDVNISEAQLKRAFRPSIISKVYAELNKHKDQS
jgi:hypothetical protein